MNDINNLSKKVIQCLLNENIQYKEIKTTLEKVLNNLDIILWQNVEISLSTFLLLKDIIWYNIELTKKEELVTFKDLGSKFPILMSLPAKNYLTNNEVKLFLNELNSITKLWNKNFKFISLFTKLKEERSKDDKVLILLPSDFNNSEKLKKYMKINSKNSYIGTLSGNVGEYGPGQVIKSLLTELITFCDKAIEKNVGLKIEFNS